MPIVPLTEIEVRKRQRQNIPTTHINSLKESIAARGNLHPPVCWFDAATRTWVLTVGECRLKAIQKLAEEKKPYSAGGTRIDPGNIFITSMGERTEIERFEAELDENVRRLDLDWQDRAQAYADLHSMRVAQNPTHTMADTRRELVEKGATTLRSGAPMSNVDNTQEVRRAITIAEHLHDENVRKARTPEEAIAYIYRTEEEKIRSALIKRGMSEAPKKTDLVLYHADLTAKMPDLEPGIVDLIIADPPYGIGADSSGFRDRTVVHHNYKDTPELAKRLAQTILSEGFRVTKQRANLFMFCDIDLFPHLKQAAANFGWVPFRRPLIWLKSESEGMAPWGGQGPRITSEFIFFATKGQRGMNASPIDVFNVKRVPRDERIHGAQKPLGLLTQLIECTTLPGDLVLDPCCGSGSTLVACRDARRLAIGIEQDETAYNTAFANVFSKELENA